MFILDGKPLSPDKGFTHDGINYPSNWLRLSTLEERTAIGITEVPDLPLYDPRFYVGYDSDGNLIPRDHDELVIEFENSTRRFSYEYLAPTDWYIVREQETGAPVPDGVKPWRQETRNACEAKVTTIELTTTTDELAEYITYVTPSGGAPTDYSYWPPAPSGIH